jgi:hypothetical protein
MRWMMIAFLASLAALLLVAAGVARRIWLHRRRLRSEPKTGAGPANGPATKSIAERGEEPDPEV